jgi:hypothetical protein
VLGRKIVVRISRYQVVELQEGRFQRLVSGIAWMTAQARRDAAAQRFMSSTTRARSCSSSWRTPATDDGGRSRSSRAGQPSHAVLDVLMDL